MDKWEIKGPWEVVDHNWEESSIYDADKDCVCSIRISFEVTEETQDHFEQITADKARAIAALPELVEAAEPFSEIMDIVEERGLSGMTMPGEPIEDWHTIPVTAGKLRVLRSALLKAKGGEG